VLGQDPVGGNEVFDLAHDLNPPTRCGFLR